MKHFLFLLFTLSGITAKAQFEAFNDFTETDRAWMVNAGYIYQQQSIIELGVKRTSTDRDSNPSDGQFIFQYLNYAYMNAGAEFMLYPDPQIAPKAGLGYHLFLFNVDVNVIFYNKQFKAFYPTLMPEAGLSIFGIVQLDYGINFALGKANDFNEKSRFSVHLNYFIGANGWEFSTKKDLSKRTSQRIRSEKKLRHDTAM